MGKLKKKTGKKADVSGKPKVLSQIQSRKAERKNARKLKKQRKADFLGRKYGRIQEVDEDIEAHEMEQVVEEKDEEKLKEERRLSKEKKVEKQRKKQRKKQLVLENKKEEMEIKKLEKNLNIKKRKDGTKTKGLSLFDDDGLNDLLNFCDDRPDLDELMRDDNQPGVQEESEDDSNQEMSDNSDQEEVEEELEDQEDMEDEAEEEIDDVKDAGDDSEQENDDQDDFSSNNEDSEPEQEENSEETTSQTWEDIYGRTRDAKGNVVDAKEDAPQQKYVPPALRAQAGSDREKRLRLERQVKGQLNRLAESNLHMISRQLEDYYGQNSRNDMNEVLCKLVTDSLTDSPVLTPERLVMEHAVLIAILHANIGTEVGASIVQSLVTEFEQKYEKLADEESGKVLENYVQLLSQLYAFKVIADELVFGMLDKFATRFSAKDVELILLTLKTVGFLLRKDDPQKLKSLIIKIQSSAAEKQDSSEDSRTKFMLEILLAIKNNNVKKIPNYDPSHQQHLQKIIKSFLRQGAQVTPLKIGYQELLHAGKVGRWWIVGSAWTGAGPSTKEETKPEGPRFSSQLLELARKMRMNTDARKDIFCSMMSSEDYLEATERLLKLKLKTQHKEREVIFVILTCCLKEKQAFNPFYAQLTEKLASVDRKYRMAAQYAMWDKVKEVEGLKQHEAKNLALYTAKLIQNQALNLASLKVIEFSDMNKTLVKFLKRILIELLADKDSAQVFTAIAGVKPLASFREGLRLFMRHFMMKNCEEDLKSRLEKAESWLTAGDKRMYL